MPQAAPVYLDDREATPVTHVYTPGGVDNNGVWRFYNKSVDEPSGRETFTVGLTRGARNRVQMRLTLPVMATETINGVSKPVIARTNRAMVEFVFDNNSTKQERENAVGLMHDALDVAKTQLNIILTDVEEPY